MPDVSEFLEQARLWAASIPDFGNVDSLIAIIGAVVGAIWVFLKWLHRKGKGTPESVPEVRLASSTEETLKKLLEATQRNAGGDPGQASQIADQQRQIEELRAAIETINVRAASPAAPPAAILAAEALRRGDARAASEQLGAAADAAAQGAQAAVEQAASLYRQQIALLRTFDVVQAYRACERALVIVPDDIELQGDAGDLAVLSGDTAKAIAHFAAMLELSLRLSSHEGATEAASRLVAVSHDRIGDIRAKQGDLAGALTSYEAGLAIRQKLAQRDPGNSEWQRDLSVSHNKIGNIRAKQGDLAGTLTSYEADLAIAQKLAQRDPGNSEWQTDVAVSLFKLGSLADDRPLTVRLAQLREALAILERLEGEGRLTPVQKPWLPTLRAALDDLG